MTDDELEQRLRAHYRSFDPGLAPPALGMNVVDALERRRRQPTVRGGPGPAFAAVMAAVVVVAVGLIVGLRPGGNLGVPGASAPAASQASSSWPSASPNQTADASAGPTSLPPGPKVQAGGLTDPLHGWAVVDHRLWVTGDGGSTWRDVTPPGGPVTANAADVLGVAFVDAQHGWIAINETFTTASDASYGRVDIWRTTDGGRTWAKTQLPRAQFAVFGEIMPAVQFDFLDVSHGFAFQSGNEAKGKNDSDLFWTADGGATWSADRPTGDGSRGNEGTIGFSTPTDGVIMGAMRDNGIVVTHDGGRTWSGATLTPPGASGMQLFFARPIFFDGQSGLVSIAFQSDTSSVTKVYRTSDAGSSWTLAATLPTGVSAISFLDRQRWIAIGGSEVVNTTDGGQTWVVSPAVGPPGAPESLVMTDARHGSVLIGMNVCLSSTSTCSSQTGLYATVDGGASWIKIWPK